MPSIPGLPNPAVGVGMLGGAGQQFLSFLQNLPQQLGQWQQYRTQQQQLATKGLQQLAQIGAAIPGIASSPQYVNSVSHYLRTMRIDPSLVIRNGSVNIAALGGQSQASKLLGDPSFVSEAQGISNVVGPNGRSPRDEWWSAQNLGSEPDIIKHLPYIPQTTSRAQAEATNLLVRLSSPNPIDPLAAATYLKALKNQLNPDEYDMLQQAILQAGRSTYAQTAGATGRAKLNLLNQEIGLDVARTDETHASTRHLNFETQVLGPAQVQHLQAQDSELAASTQRITFQINSELAQQQFNKAHGLPINMSLAQYDSYRNHTDQMLSAWTGKLSSYQYYLNQASLQPDATTPVQPGTAPEPAQQNYMRWAAMYHNAQHWVNVYTNMKKGLSSLSNRVEKPISTHPGNIPPSSQSGTIHLRNGQNVLGWYDSTTETYYNALGLPIQVSLIKS